MARPSPALDPVTNATLPVRSKRSDAAIICIPTSLLVESLAKPAMEEKSGCAPHDQVWFDHDAMLGMTPLNPVKEHSHCEFAQVLLRHPQRGQWRRNEPCEKNIVATCHCNIGRNSDLLLL